jgi:hypothetical protein
MVLMQVDRRECEETELLYQVVEQVTCSIPSPETIPFHQQILLPNPSYLDDAGTSSFLVPFHFEFVLMWGLSMGEDATVQR